MLAERLADYPADTQSDLRELAKKAEHLSKHPSVPPFCPWDVAVEIAERCALGEYERDPDLERLYRKQFRATVLRHYKTMSDCVLIRLGWQRPPDPPLPAHLRSFSADLEHPQHIRVVLNEWPYSIDADMEHVVVWTRLPCLHESNHPTQNEIRNGLSGFSWLPDRDSSAAAELGRFVRNRWPAHEAIYFANPPHLQSIAGVSHFHVLLREKKNID